MTRVLMCGIMWVIGSTGMKEGYVMFQAIFYLIGTTLNAWLVINEAGKGRENWSNVWLVVCLFCLSASVSGLVRAVMLMG